MKQTLTEPKGERDKSTIIVGHFNTNYSVIYRKKPAKNQKRYLQLNNTIYQLDLIDSFTPSYPMTSEYTVFSSEHETLTKTDSMLRHKAFSVNFKGLKSYRVCSLITKKLN